MLNIQKQALQKGYMITNSYINDNEIIKNNKIAVGRVYQDNHKIENIIVMDFKRTKILFKQVYDLNLLQKEYEQLTFDENTKGKIMIFKINYILFGGAVWNLLN